MKKFIGSLVAAGIMFSGCVDNLVNLNQPTQQKVQMQTNTNLPKLNLAVYVDNPILNVETDLVLAEELATVLKFNNLLLDRMPVSTQDLWPELLYDYDQKHPNIPKEAIRKYDDCLLKELIYDYSFYRYYDPIELRKQIKSVAGLAILANPSAIKKIAMLKVIENYGKKIEHTKNVISYKPFTCNCQYFNPKFKDYLKPVPKRVCLEIDKKMANKCEFFSKPLEEIFYKYEDSFLNLKVGASCFKPVEGKAYPSFRVAFYELLPNKYKTMIKKADEDFLNISEKIASLEAEIKLKKEKKQDVSALEKKLDSLKKEEENIKARREKLFSKALKEIEVSKDKVKLAMKLKKISDYINHSLGSVGIGTTVLTVSTIFDVKELLNLGANSKSAIMMTAVVYLHDNKAKNEKEAIKMAEERLKLLLKRAASLPKNALTIAYGIGAQKSFISDYADYIDAYVKLASKLK